MWWLIAACRSAEPVPAPPVDVPVPVVEAVPAPRFEVRQTPLPDALRGQMEQTSWRPGCPTPMDALRLVEVVHWTFEEGQTARGQLVVHHRAVEPITDAFRAAFDEGFPIRSVRPVSEFGGSDAASMAADNTSAFNCRKVKGTSAWSERSTGRAIDVNPRENPWARGGKVDPPEGAPFVDRAEVRPGMLTADSAMTRSMLASGWGWGGQWSSLKDWQHFSESGR